MLIITWNIYHGTLQGHTLPAHAAAGLAAAQPGATIADRLRYILTIGNHHNVDMICIQEIRKADIRAPGGGAHPVHGALPAASPAGAVLAASGLAYSGYCFDSENNPTGAGYATTQDAYLFLFRNATFPAGVNAAGTGYYNPAAFNVGGFIYLRPPAGISITDVAGTVYRIYNWHADSAAAHANISVGILSGLSGGFAANTIIAGDFNVRGDLTGIGIANPFPACDNYCDQFVNATTGALFWGLDHIVTNILTGNAVLGAELNFLSDVHAPVAADL